MSPVSTCVNEESKACQHIEDVQMTVGARCGGLSETTNITRSLEFKENHSKNKTKQNPVSDTNT